MRVRIGVRVRLVFVTFYSVIPYEAMSSQLNARLL